MSLPWTAVFNCKNGRFCDRFSFVFITNSLQINQNLLRKNSGKDLGNILFFRRLCSLGEARRRAEGNGVS
jgi:hypothetical protein